MTQVISAYKQIQRLSGAEVASQYIAPPSGLGLTLPFNVLKIGQRRYTTDFNPQKYYLREQAAYYLAPWGDDGDDGLSPLTPKLTPATLIGTLNSSTPRAPISLFFAPGIYAPLGNIAFDANIICPNGQAIFTTRQSGLSWTESGTYPGLYTATAGAGTHLNASVVDLAYVDQFGIAKRLVRAASALECSETPGSYFTTASPAIGVFLEDEREPDEYVVLHGFGDNWLQTSSQKLFFQNIGFWGTNRPGQINNASGAGTYVFDNCEFLYSAGAFNGLDVAEANADTLTIMHRSRACYNRYDGVGYRGFQAAIEIDCVTTNNGAWIGSSNDNGTTTHDSVKSARINTISRFNEDRNIHDIELSKNWLVGCTIGDAQNSSTDPYDNANYIAGREGFSDATRSWLEGCTCTGGSAGDIGSYGTAIVETFDNTGFAITDTDGTATITERV
jgi:hypothetical protein